MAGKKKTTKKKVGSRGPSVGELKRQLDTQKAAIEKRDGQIDDLMTQNQEMINRFNNRLNNISTDAKDNPVDLNKTFEPMEQQIGQDHVREMRSTGDASDSLDPARIEPVDRALDSDKARELIFMEDMLTVMIHETEDVNADPFPMVICNGRRQYFIRGVEQKVRRKFIGILAQNKKARVKQTKGRDEDGATTYLHHNIHTVLHPFSVIHDPAGKEGHEWLKRVLDQGQ